MPEDPGSNPAPDYNINRSEVYIYIFFLHVALTGPKSVAINRLHPCFHWPLFAIAPYGAATNPTPVRGSPSRVSNKRWKGEETQEERKKPEKKLRERI